MNQVNVKPKKILFLITKATWGGAQRYVFDLATHLPQDDFLPVAAYGEQGRLSAMLAERGVHVHEIAMHRDISVLGDIRSFFEIFRLIRKEKPDVLHLNSSKAAALGALAGVFGGVPRIIFTAHGWPFKEDRSPLAQCVIRSISWFTVLLSHETIVVSKRDEEIGTKMPWVGHKVRFIPLGIATPEFLPREDAWQRILALARVDNPSLPRVASIGELTKNKGYRFAIDAIAHLKDRNVNCNYFIIGSGELREELEEYAIEKEVETRVFFLGFVENAARFLRAFDIYLLSSIKEGAPYVLLEAAAAKIPIVASHVIDENFAGPSATIVPGDPETLAIAIEHAIEQGSSEPNADQVLLLGSMVERTIRVYS